MKKAIKDMKEKESFWTSRMFYYVLYGITYLTFWKLISFEFAVISSITVVLGELHYQGQHKK